jgi:CheY-like chemotaxis protein
MGQKILIVDDSRTVCQAVKFAFTASPFVVDSAATAADALRVLRTGDYSAAIVDYALPDGPGVQLLRLIRTEASLMRLPVVFLTGSYHPVNLDEALAAGADVTIAKPFKTDDLLARVNDAILAAPSRSLAGPSYGSSPAIAVTPPAAEPSASHAFIPASTSPAVDEDDGDDFEIVTADEPPLTTTAPLPAATTARPVVPLPLPPPPMTGGFRRVLPPPGPDPVRRMPLPPPPPAPLRGAAVAPPVPASLPARNLAETTQHDVAPDSPSMMDQAPVVSDSGIYHAADTRVVDSVNDVPGTSSHSLRPTDGTPFATDAVPDTTPLANADPSVDDNVSTRASLQVTEEVAEDGTVELAEEVIEDVTEDVTEEIAEDVVEAVAEDVTEEVAEEIAEDVVEAVAEDDTEDDFAPAESGAVSEAGFTATAVPSPATHSLSADDLRAAVASRLDEEMVRAMLKELLPGIVKEYLAVMLRQTASKLESYSAQKIDAFVENDLNILARAAIDKYLENLQ